MWCALFLVFLGAANAEQFQAWKTDTEYLYIVRGRTLAALNDVEDHYTGIILKAMLTIRPKSMDTLQAKVWKARYARIHTNLQDGWKTEIPDSVLDYQLLPMSEKIFEIAMKHGTIRDVIADKGVPTWEVNMLKSIMSQLQVDTQGENLMPSKYNQIPEGDNISAMYKTMEDSVGGRCEVSYDINPLSEYIMSQKSQYLLNPELVADQNAIDIVKTKNYTNCEQRMSYHFGFTGSSRWDPSTNENSEFMSRSSISRIIITGNLKTFTIQSSVVTDKVVLSPNFHENEKGMVGSRVNVTLLKMSPMPTESWITPTNAESTGNLVYTYNNPFPAPGEGRRPGKSHLADDNSAERFHNIEQMDAADHYSSKRTDDSSDSLENIEQGKSYWQPLPTMNEPASIPLLPFFIGHRGESTEKSSKIDVVATVKSLARQIGSELQNPSNITEEQTLDKFTTLARLIRTMSTEQLAEAQLQLGQNPKELQAGVHRDAWTAFQAALAQAGTGPALVTIKRLIKEKKLAGASAERVVGVLSKTARIPTPEYLDVFFQMITMPEITGQEDLDASALLAFAELIRYSGVNRASAHNRYPVHSFGPLSPKENPAIGNVYIPYMSEQLRSAMDASKVSKIHMFIWALGSTAHPKVLSVFEPYLEGTYKASTFQRLLMVVSLKKLAILDPSLVRGVLYRIYQNTAETYQLRCAAVSLIVSTNPPASMLQRMAEFTHYDVSKQVTVAVKTAIESASELSTPEFQDLATKARNVLSLLKKDIGGSEYSDVTFYDYVAEEMNIASTGNIVSIGSEDSILPQAVFTSLRTMYGDFKMLPEEVGFMISSFKDLFKGLGREWRSGEDSKKENPHNFFAPERIAKILNFETGFKDKFEAVWWLSDSYENFFYSLDEQSLSRLSDDIKKTIANAGEGQEFDETTFQSNDVTLSFPLESGLPFFYFFKMPSVSKVSSSMTGFSDSKTIEGSLNLTLLYGIQLQSRFGAIALWENQQYVAGVNQDYQIYLPISATVTYDDAKKQTSLKLEPINKNERYTVMESRTVPYTSRFSVLSTSPVITESETNVLTKGEVWKKDAGNHPFRTPAFNVEIESEFDTYSLTSPHEDVWKKNPILRFGLGLGRDTIEYYKTTVYVTPHPASSQSFTLSASYETLLDDSMKRNEKKSETFKEKSLQPKDPTMKDPKRRKQLLEEVAWGIVGAEAFVADIGVELPGQENMKLVMTVAYADSKVDEKSQGLVYLRLNNYGDSGEVCIRLESESLKASIFDMEVAGKTRPKSTWFNIDVRAGPTCPPTSIIQIMVNQSQSESYRKAMKESPSASECLNATTGGRLATTACRELNDKMSTMDEAEMTVRFGDYADSAKVALSQLVETRLQKINSAIFYRGMQYNHGLDDNTLEFTMVTDPLDNTGTFMYRSTENHVQIPAIDLSSWLSISKWLSNVDPDLSPIERMDLKLNGLSASERTCIIDTNSATTFDHSTYPLDLGTCWHVVLSTNPFDTEASPWSWKPRKAVELSIVARDAEDKKKEFLIVFGNTELRLKPSKNGIVAIVDGAEINFIDTPIYRHKIGESIEFEVFSRPDDSIKVTSSKFDIDAIYNGQDLRIKASDYYRNEVRGLCGNYNGDPEDDFVNPKQCFVEKWEEFVASYALLRDDCQSVAQDRSNQLDKETECRRKVIRPNNVITDWEAGRRNRSFGSSSWGYHPTKSRI
ncbi:vitellogenin-like isoform X2 [Venturia canescens]|uniref:vitellogenin-like isoform X2 n=1 Tax=Venturia canescens TaxID=32260 RepID=UPI001C9CB56B|nr:vitellogenin-like isoform X2 [Venturia canescens]